MSMEKIAVCTDNYYTPFSVFVFVQSDAHSSAIFTAEEEIFAFERTISRLTEMQTEQYWNWQGFRKSWDVFSSWHGELFYSLM